MSGAKRPGAIRPTATTSAALTQNYIDDLRDPGRGEKLDRCAVCGKPNRHAIRGKWDGDGKVYRILVCSYCVVRESKLDPDPLHVSEDAA